jgi:hypothetical protein
MISRAGMSVTLSLDEEQIKIVISRGTQIEKWETGRLPPHSIQDGQILLPEDVAGTLKSMLKTLRVPRNPLAISVNLPSFVYRTLTLPPLKPAIFKEAVLRAAQKEIHLPLADFYLEWQIIAQNRAEVRVFVLGVPRRSIDSIAQCLALAGVKIGAIELRSLTIARMVDQPAALIADFESECCNLIIIADGLPVILHSVIPRDKTADIEDKALQIADELNRTIEYYNLTHKEKPVPADMPLILTGSLAPEPGVSDWLLKNSGRPAGFPEIGLHLPAGFPTLAYSGNLGLILKNRPGAAHENAAPYRHKGLDINLWTARQRALSRPVTLRQTFAPAAIVLATALVLPLSLACNQARAETASLESELADVDRSLHIHRQTIAFANETQDKIAELTAEINQIQNERQTISGQTDLAQILNLLADQLPPEATINRLTADAKEVVIDGRAASRQTVIQYADLLSREKALAEIRIALINATEAADNTGLPVLFKIIIER